ncbi:unnamed protein product, partial [marine sediment metagenome]
DALFWWRKVTWTCADVYTCLEGDYSSYAELWNVRTVSYDEPVCYGVISIDGERVYVKGNNRDYIIINLADGTIIDEGAGYYPPMVCLRFHAFRVVLFSASHGYLSSFPYNSKSDSLLCHRR